MLEIVDDGGSHGVYLAYSVHRVAEKFHAYGYLRAARRKNVHRISAHPEGGTHKIEIRALVLYVHQPPDQLVLIHGVALADGHRLGVVVHRGAESVYAGHARHHDDVPPLAQRRRCGMAELVDLVVDLKLLFDVCVGARNVRFRLIVVVVADEKLHAIVRKKLSELVAKLRRQRLVVRDDERGTLQARNDVSHRERLAAPRHAEKNFRGEPVFEPGGEFVNGGGLISARRITADKFERFHNPEIC